MATNQGGCYNPVITDFSSEDANISPVSWSTFDTAGFHLTLGLLGLSHLWGTSLPTPLVSLSTFQLFLFGTLHSFLAGVNY